ncbi:MAG: polysaccharide biosynthesis tyrosine autokinase [Deltaproteobacteria bacterium]|nr:polysaccharide biosynthesis tyrosine autokinase [Deltaproteobacteria bacterium]
MSFFLKRNYYEALGVSFDASAVEIEQAYDRSKRLLSDGSEAVYSLYSEEEKRERLQTIEEAHRTLSDLKLKKEYDAALSSNANADGTYEVDLGYIFGGQGKEASAHAAPVMNTRKYRQVKFARTIAAVDKNESVANEQFKLLSSKLEIVNKKIGQKVVAFTSAIKSEGKSTVSFNTAFVLATAFSKNVLFVECDLRKPSGLQEFVSADGPGLLEVLKGEAQIDEAICEVEETGLHVLYSGAYDKYSADLIGSSNTASVLDSLRQRFDFILLDCPPVIPLADMSILEKLVDGIVLVVRAGETSKELVKNATESLEKKKFIGTVLNGAETKLDKYYY